MLVWIARVEWIRGYCIDQGGVIEWVMWFGRWDVWLVLNIPTLNLLLFHLTYLKSFFDETKQIKFLYSFEFERSHMLKLFQKYWVVFRPHAKNGNLYFFLICFSYFPLGRLTIFKTSIYISLKNLLMILIILLCYEHKLLIY